VSAKDRSCIEGSLCQENTGSYVAVEVKRHATIDAVEQLDRYLEFFNRDPQLSPSRGILAAQTITKQARTVAEDRGIDMWSWTMTNFVGLTSKELTLF
jgi:RecB family endonuclease NucS